jgi:hypothetical protein
MSHMGQKRRLELRPVTSGLPLSTDILSVRRHVSNVPDSDFSGENGCEVTCGHPRNPSRAPSLRGTLGGSVGDNAQQVLTCHSLFTEKPCSGTLRFGSYGFEGVCASYHGAA